MHRLSTRSRRVVVLLALAVLCAVGLNACTHYRVNARFIELPSARDTSVVSDGAVEVHFLGTGGIYLRTANATLLADPFFSNPSLWRLLPGVATSSNEPIIRQRMGRLPDLDHLEAILVTHSHYDHAMDLPFIMANYARGVPVYGSPSLATLLKPLDNPQVMSLADMVIDPDGSAARWTTLGPRLRFATIAAEHLDHLPFIKYAGGEAREDDELPKGLWNWKEGATYSFLIDVLDANGAPQWRIFFMPSAARGKAGFPPRTILDEHKVDLAVIGSTQLPMAPGWPQELLDWLDPDAVMLVHWDDFFDNNASLRPPLVPMFSPGQLARRINRFDTTRPVYWPQRNAVLRLPLR